ncbi:carboxypeptidase regulatory-like domain-containing protein [Acidipila sp. EB88]|uniref:carboxypeptidase regulatory-like domain-containing protein n=1 Tax=Acidipila sp. EB88 TaxID=2305226 RepID=UPI000F5F6FC3|nr:carboxypeptidase regulatory-like domain-containing protein [Acidipila sp. EB88]RRA48712.1 TonB-dependent receptor [Acidipila sp. EB88]
MSVPCDLTLSESKKRLQQCALRVTLLTVASAALATTANAQFRASIQGTVSDPKGNVISGATVTLTDADTARVLTAVSNGSGTYNFNALAPDHYTLSASAPGFQQQVINNLQLIPEQANSVNVQMVVGAASSSVTVRGDQVAALDTETAAIGGSIDANQIQHLPSAGRDVFQLVQLAPGVFGDGAQAAGGGTSNLPGNSSPGGTTSSSGIFATENGPQANANGGQSETNGIQIDGISTVSAVWGGTSIITPTEDSVGNVKVISNTYDAENGRFSGAGIQITSKTGTNQYHGSLFFRANRPGLNAYQRYNGPGSFNPGTPAARGLLRDTTRANQLGGSVGGPILRDRLFAFFAYETQRNNASTTSTGWYETAAFRALAPAGSIASKYLTFPGAAVAASSIVNQTCAQAGFSEGINCRTIQGQGLNLGTPLNQPLGTQDLTWQSVTDPGVGAGLGDTADVALYNTVNPSSTVASQFNGRLDADVTKKDHVAFAIYWVPLTTTNYDGTVRAYNLYHHEQTNDAYSLIWNHVFSPTFLNEARANDAGWRWNEILTNPQEPFGLPQSQVGGLANITGTNQLAFFGAPGPSNFNQHTYTYKDIATKIAGNHSVKFGGDVTRLYYLNNPTYSARPSYTFYNIWDFLNDAPNAESGSFDPATGTPTTNRQDDREDLYGFFVQDDWKARPNLTLNLGLRYAYFGPLSSKENNLNRVVLGEGATAYTNLYVHQGGNLTQAQKGNFGPQFGFSFSPAKFNGKAVVRGGFGLNFNQTEVAITGNAGSNPPNVLAVAYNSGSPTAINPRIVYGIASDSNSLFGYPANPNAIGGFNTANLPTAGGAFITAYQATQPTVYTEHFSLDTQFDLGHQFVATAGYQGSMSRHLIVQNFAYVNAFAYGQAQNPLVQNIDYYGNTGHSSNNSLLLGLKHQMSHGIMFDAEFNYAKTMDTGSSPYYEDPYPYQPGLAWGRSDFNYGKALKLYGLWQPVLFHGNTLLNKTLGGIGISGIYNLHTGFPYTPTYSVPGGNLYYAASGYSSLRPAAFLGGAGHHTGNDAFEDGKLNANFPLNASLGTGGTTSAYFANPVAPVAQANGFATGLPTLPGVSRNSFTGPGYEDFDGTVTKSFGLPSARVIGENANIEIRADAFNLFNQINLDSSSMVTNYLLSTFGQAQKGLSARIVNLQARFSF